MKDRSQKFWDMCKAQKVVVPYFPNLDCSSLCTHAYSEASFVENADYFSQLGYIISLSDKKNCANLFYGHPMKRKVS